MTEMTINEKVFIAMATELRLRKEKAYKANDSIAVAFVSGALAVIQEFINEMDATNNERGELPC